MLALLVTMVAVMVVVAAGWENKLESKAEKICERAGENAIATRDYDHRGARR